MRILQEEKIGVEGKEKSCVDEDSHFEMACMADMSLDMYTLFLF